MAILFQAMLRTAALGLAPRTLWIVVDCQSALDALAAPAASCLLLLAAEAAESLKALKSSGWEVHAFWCPSHNKKLEWRAPVPLQTSLCRLLNEEADVQARRAMQRRLAGSLRASRLRRQPRECRALCASAKASEVYRDHFAELQRRAREGDNGSARDSHD